MTERHTAHALLKEVLFAPVTPCHCSASAARDKGRVLPGLKWSKNSRLH